jgi:hypothetical protein
VLSSFFLIDLVIHISVIWAELAHLWPFACAISAGCIFFLEKRNSCYRLQFSYDMASCTFLEKGATHFLREKVQVAPKTIKIYIKKVELI